MNFKAITKIFYELTNGQDKTGEAAANTLALDFPNSVAREYPDVFPVCWESVEAVLKAIAISDLSPLSRRSPGLKGYDWTAYLRCSTVRMAKALSALRDRLQPSAKVLDMGSYFGNFSLALAKSGYLVEAADSYLTYQPAFDSVTRLMSASGIRIRDLDEPISDNCYDAVLMMGVIEHIPHTPRLVLEQVNRALRPGGFLIIDTPNLAYIYNRQKLSRGDSPYAPISTQYYSDLPFEGHHREYTSDEVRWMLQQLGHADIMIDMFCYSMYALPVLDGENLQNYLAMQRDPACCELIFSISQKSF